MSMAVMLLSELKTIPAEETKTTYSIMSVIFISGKNVYISFCFVALGCKAGVFSLSVTVQYLKRLIKQLMQP